MIRLLALAVSLAAAFTAGALTVMLLPAAEPGRWHVRDEKDAPLRWSDTGEAVETYQTFTLPPPLRAVEAWGKASYGRGA